MNLQPLSLDHTLISANAGGDGMAVRRKPLRVALITGNYHHVVDGVSLTLNRLVAYLEKEGHRVLVLGPTTDAPAIDHAGMLVPSLSMPLPGRPEYRVSMGLTRGMRRTLRTFKPDILHIATPDLLGMSALGWAKRQGIPVVSSYHTHFASYLSYFNLKMLEPMLWSRFVSFYNRCKQVYVPSPAMKVELSRRGVLVPIHLWARGINRGRFAPGKRSLLWRTSVGLATDVPVVSFVSRLVWEKGLDVFASVVRRLEKNSVAHQSLVVGDGPAMNELRQRLPNTVFTGYLSGNALSTAYASSNIFLFPSETETFGNVTLEAMASGLPVVCANAAGSKSLVENGKTGFLCTPRNVDSFYKATVYLLNDLEDRRSMGSRARRFSSGYEWTTVLRTLVEHYFDVLGEEQIDKTPALSTAL